MAGAVRRVVVIGPSHHAAFRGIAVPTAQPFATPLGRVPVDREALSSLAGLRFVGLADVGNGLTNVAMVVPERDLANLAGDRDGFMDRWLRSKPQLAPRVAAAQSNSRFLILGAAGLLVLCGLSGALIVAGRTK